MEFNSIQVAEEDWEISPVPAPAIPVPLLTSSIQQAVVGLVTLCTVKELNTSQRI